MKRPDIYKVPLVKNTFIREKETKRALVNFLADSDKLSMGEKCKSFEKAFALMQGRKEALLFSSGSSANLAIIQALKNLGRLKYGDRVGFSSITWSTNVMPIIQLGLEAVPIDCSPETLNSMSEPAISSLIKNQCKAFFITNALGLTGDLEEIRKKCNENGIILLEDNCEALGTELPSGKAGNFGLASSFSFYVAHHISTIEGGMVCTDEPELADMVRMVRSNGWDRNLSAQRQKYWRAKHNITSKFDSKYTFYDLGFNVRPTEITGFIGLYQLQFLDQIIKIREKNFTRVEKEIALNPDMLPVNRSYIKTFSPFALPFVFKTAKLRQKYLERFNRSGVEVRPMISGNIVCQPFFKKYVKKKYSLPGTEFLHQNSFYCGNCPDYTEQELRIIIKCIKHLP